MHVCVEKVVTACVGGLLMWCMCVAWKVVTSELAARLGIDNGPEVWNFRHSRKTTNVGNPVGYRIVPGTGLALGWLLR